MSGTGQDRLKARRALQAGAESYDYYALDAVREAGIGDVSRLPYSMKVLLENLLRHEDGRTVTVADIEACAAWLETRSSTHEIAFHPARTLLQDFTGVPAVVDLAAMRQAMADLGGDPQKINPLGHRRPGDRPLGDGRQLRLGRCVRRQCRPRIRAQPGALFLPPLGLEGVQQFPRGAARHRYLPPGQSGAPRPDRLDPRGRRPDPCLSGHAGRGPTAIPR